MESARTINPVQATSLIDVKVKQTLREKYEQDLTSIEEELRGLTSAKPERSSYGNDTGDQAQYNSAVHSFRVNEARLEGNREGLTLALNRLEDPEFGRCVDCRQAIETEKLLASAGSERCMVCQKKKNQERLH